MKFVLIILSLLILHLFMLGVGAEPEEPRLPRASCHRQQGAPGQPDLPLRHLPH